MNDATRIALQLREAIDEGMRLFDGVPEDATARRPAAGKWCAREVIGHLIDSACNNHRRFVINQSTDMLVIDGYAQNEWVSRQRYHDALASELVPLWAQYNRRIANVIEAIPHDVLTRPRGPMAAHRFSYFDVPRTEFATLGYVAEDYVGHIRHHLRQIQSLLAR